MVIMQRLLLCTLIIYPVNPQNTAASNLIHLSARRELSTIAIGESVSGRILRVISNESQLESRNSIFHSSGTHKSILHHSHITISEGIPLSNDSQSDGKDFLNTRSDDNKLIFFYQNTRKRIWTYVPPIIITVGVMCNLLSLIVWVRSIVKKRGSSSSYFFACLSVADGNVLLFVPMNFHIGHAYVNSMVLRDYSNFMCKMFSFMYPFSLSFTSYMLASLALFRMVGALYPHRYKQICSERNAKRVIVGIIIFTILVHFPAILGFELNNLDGNGPVCFYKTNWNFRIRVLLQSSAMLVTYYFPMLIVVLANVGIIWKLAKKRTHSIGTTRRSPGDHAFSRTVTVLITISLVYVITMCPMSYISRILE